MAELREIAPYLIGWVSIIVVWLLKKTKLADVIHPNQLTAILSFAAIYGVSMLQGYDIPFMDVIFLTAAATGTAAVTVGSKRRVGAQVEGVSNVLKAVIGRRTYTGGNGG